MSVRQRVNSVFIYSLKEFDSVSLLHNLPDVAEASVDDAALNDDGEKTEKHYDYLEDIGPHYSFHAALERKE